VLDAERSLYSAEDSLIQSRVSLAKDYVALGKALGGGWDAPVDASRPDVADEPWDRTFGPSLRRRDMDRNEETAVGRRQPHSLSANR